MPVRWTGAETACRAAGAADVLDLPADVGSHDDVQRLVDVVLDRHGRLDVVVLTATVMAYGTIEQLPADVFETVVDTAVHGTAHVARAVLPVFRRQRGGTFVIVNSLLGSVTVPQMGAYATAKWGQRAIARTLQQEVARERGIHVCIVSPGSTNTPIYYQAANYVGKAARPPIPVLQPERVAASIVKLIDRPRKHVSIPVGPPNPVLITGFRLLPFVYDRIVGPAFKLAAPHAARREIQRRQRAQARSGSGTAARPLAGQSQTLTERPVAVLRTGGPRTVRPRPTRPRSLR